MKRKKQRKLHCNINKISNLPALVIDEILSLMSIRDAVRTSVLSKRWRYKWASLPRLVFDGECVSDISSQDKTSTFIKIVDHVLLLHHGPIHEFKLSYKEDVLGDIDRWILYVSKKSITGFRLDIWNGHPYMLPTSLFSCQSLIRLELFGCLMKPLSKFKGFKNLKKLHLQKIKIGEDVFENLIANCPMLEYLWMYDFEGFSHLNIDAPNLKLVGIEGVFHDVRFKNTFNLDEVSIHLSHYVENENGQTLDQESSDEMLNFFLNLPDIRRLTITGFFSKYCLAVGNVPNVLPNSYVNLIDLFLDLNFDDLKEGLVALCLLRSSPNLRKLEIFADEDDSNEGTVDEFWNISDHANSMFAELRLVDLANISGKKSEVDFIRFLLLNSHVLERMTIKPASADGGLEVLKALVNFQRASTRAKIIYLDP